MSFQNRVISLFFICAQWIDKLALVRLVQFFVSILWWFTLLNAMSEQRKSFVSTHRIWASIKLTGLCPVPCVRLRNFPLKTVSITNLEQPKGHGRTSLPNCSNIFRFDDAMFSLLFLVFAITTSVFAVVDPTITPAPGSGTLAVVHSTPPLAPDDPNYVFEDSYKITTSNSTESDLQKRTPPTGIYVCDLPDWKGSCRWIQVKTGSPCMDFPWQAGVSIGVSRIRPQHPVSLSVCRTHLLSALFIM